MDMGHYILDDNHQPKRVTLTEWARGLKKNRHVDLTELPNGYRISTVFLGIDHNFGPDGPPLLFETMVFPDGPEGEIQERYATWDEAKAGHAETCLRAAEYQALAGAPSVADVCTGCKAYLGVAELTSPAGAPWCGKCPRWWFG